jgi:hypothetical protein
VSSPQFQRRDPQPLARGGDVAILTLTAVAVGWAFAALVGLGAACALFGGGWVWPDSGARIDTLAGLLAGEPGGGLPVELRRRVPDRGIVYSCLAAAELLLIAAATAGAALFARYHRPGDARRGMATRQQARQVLGTGRLAAAKAIIRPDLYRSHRRGEAP